MSHPHRVVILLPMVWSVRNVVHGGVLHALKGAGIAAHLVMRPCDALKSAGTMCWLDEAAGLHPMIGAEARFIPGRAFLDDVVSSAFQQRHRLRSHDIYRNWFTRHQRPAERLRSHLVEAAGRLVQRDRLRSTLETAAAFLSHRSRDLAPIRRQLRRLAPDLIWSTVNVSGWESGYRIAAHELGVPVVTSVLSFDNLTSRGPLPRDDHYLVWGPRMRDQLLRLYPDVTAAQVSVTGTPQFDLHTRGDCRWTRRETLAALGLLPSHRYFLYAASHPSLTPDEPALVSALAARMAAHDSLAGHRLVVRWHPLDSPGRWTGVREADERICLSAPFSAGATTAGWAVPDLADAARLTSSLFHADGCLNVASTMSLDAAVLDRPVICLDFRTEPAARYEMLYAEYGCEHYAPLVASGGLRVARTWTELLEFMTQAIDAPHRDRDMRARMVEAECGPVDGQAARRIVAALGRASSPRPEAQREGVLGADSRLRANDRPVLTHGNPLR